MLVSILKSKAKTKAELPKYAGTQYAPFSNIEVDPMDFAGFIKQSMAWSPFTFKDGCRSNANSSGITGCLVLDYDDGLYDADYIYKKLRSLEYMNFLFSSQIIFSTSASYSEGAYKYRIIIPFQESLKTNKEDWALFYRQFCEDMDELGIKFDRLGDLGRFFYSLESTEVTVYGDDILPSFRMSYNMVLRKAKRKLKAIEDAKKESQMLNALYGSKRRARSSGSYPKDIEFFYSRSTRFKRYVDDINSAPMRGKTQYGLMNWLKACEYSSSDFRSFVLNHSEINWSHDDIDNTLKHNMQNW